MRQRFAGGRRKAVANGAGSRRCGVAVVEFAMIAPVLALLMIGLLELGRAIMVREALNNAVRRGCRTAILPGRDNAAVTADVDDVLSENALSTAARDLTILVNDRKVDVATARQGDKITVRVSIPYAATSWSGSFFLRNRNVSSEITMMRQ